VAAGHDWGLSAMRKGRSAARLGCDIGGTFTDAVLEAGGGRWTAKVLTTHTAPEEGVLAAIAEVLAAASLTHADLALVIHGTTLATNALIERKGARTGLVTTAGFRDVLAIRLEHRFDLYDLGIEQPKPLVERALRLPVQERIAADGRVLLPLKEEDLHRAAAALSAAGVEAVAVGFLHSWRNPAHERRAAELLAALLPSVAITLSSEVAPEMREYERFSTAVANAYVQPLMAAYLGRLEQRLRAAGACCPLLMMLSGGGLTTLETARRFPVRLVESGPAGGAVFAASVAAELGLADVLSFDMGGTTAKICLVDDGVPQTARGFEVARVYRFKKGSGLPLRIPVVEMVEIGAGGGSIARVDRLGRLGVGPDSAGSEPGPVAYGRGGAAPTVTDADLVLGRIDPRGFAGGRFPLYLDAARVALGHTGVALGLDAPGAAAGVARVVDETVAAAARVHALEGGKTLRGRGMIVFGGAAPLHAAAVAERVGIDAFIVPEAAGVGSAVGFLRAPVAYEIARSWQVKLAALEGRKLDAMLAALTTEARVIVVPAAGGAKLIERRFATMRYQGQGHEITVALPARGFGARAAAVLRALFEAAYAKAYGRIVPNAEPEAMTWSVTVSTVPQRRPRATDAAKTRHRRTRATREVMTSEGLVGHAVFHRADLTAGDSFAGPALVEENETTTLLPAGWRARVAGNGALICRRGGR